MGGPAADEFRASGTKAASGGMERSGNAPTIAASAECGRNAVRIAASAECGRNAVRLLPARQCGHTGRTAGVLRDGVVAGTTPGMAA